MGQLVVTPAVVASKINNMKENKSPGVDGLSPKILKETVAILFAPCGCIMQVWNFMDVYSYDRSVLC